MRVGDPSNDWEQSYRAAAACPACGRADVHASDCAVLHETRRKARRFGAPVVLAAFGFAIWQGAVGNVIVAVAAGSIGCAMAALAAERARRSR